MEEISAKGLQKIKYFADNNIHSAYIHMLLFKWMHIDSELFWWFEKIISYVEKFEEGSYADQWLVQMERGTMFHR